jgi:hypothetical protein
MITLTEAQELHEIIGEVLTFADSDLDRELLKRALEMVAVIVYDLDPDNRTDES